MYMLILGLKVLALHDFVPRLKSQNDITIFVLIIIYLFSLFLLFIFF